MVYPTTLWSDGDNSDDVAEVNAAYMNERDDEIMAIENALGAGLVPNTSTSLQSRLKVINTANKDLLLAYQDSSRVGIGALSGPGAQLHVVANVDGPNAEIIRVGPGAAATSYVSIGMEKDDLWGMVQSWKAGAAGPLAINPNGGDVGIGTTEPERQLHLKRHSTGDNELRVENFNDDTDSSARVILRLTNRWHSAALVYNAVRHATYPRVLRLANNDPQGDIRFYAGAADRVLIDKDGKVGIGTTQPDTRLHVDGAITLDDTADPTSVAADRTALYTRKNGSDKMELVVRFPSGNPKVVVTED